MLMALVAIPAVRGIRRILEDGKFETVLEPGFVEGVRRVGRAGLPFEIGVRHWGLTFGLELARRCPDVTFVLDHIGKPGIKHGLREPWWSQIRELAKLPNVVCKVSGVITEADHGAWTKEQVKPYVAHTIECFGFDRVMYGSDWTVSELTHPYPTWVDILDEVAKNIGTMPGTTICGLADGAGWPIKNAIAKFRPELEDYIKSGQKTKMALVGTH